ncbi:MAG: hypothetical protein OEN55_05100 [Alphaproteobacteria bacterium]|nr:hypothetical protein [Alphaproteobacteria bacterium]
MSVAAARKSAPPLADRHTVGLFYALAAIAALYPLLGVDIPPLVDYPAHLARLHILSSIAGDAAIQANYEVAWRPVPNLGMDLLASPLVALLGVYGAGKLFVALSILTPVAGAAALRKALYGAVGYAPALAFLAAYNLCLAWGFLNFLFATGLSLMVYAGWIATRDWAPVGRAVCFAGAAMVIFLGHLFAFATYALLIGLDLLQHLLRNRGRPVRVVMVTLVVGGSQFLLPGVLMVAAVLAGSGGYAEYGTVAGKLRVLLTPFYSVGAPADYLLAIFTVGVVAWAAATRRLTVVPEMRAALFLFIVVGVAMPVWLMRTWGVDMRMPMVVAFVAIAATRLRINSGRAGAVLVGILVALFAGRLSNTADRWSGLDRDYAEFRTAVSVIPQGSRVISVQPLTDDLIERAGAFPQAYWGLPSIAVIERSAFVPTLFTDPEKQILRAAARNEIIDTPFGRPPTIEELQGGADRALRGAVPGRHHTGKSIFWTDWPHRFDYVIALFRQPPGDGIGRLLDPVHAGSYFTIYRVVAGSCEARSSGGDAAALPACARDAGGGTEMDGP